MAEPARTQSPELGTGHNIWARRDLLSIAAWGAILSCIGVGVLAWVRMMFPRVLFEPPTAFKAGFPTDFQVGEVSTKYMTDQRVWIVRTASGFYAIIGICTHLGCTPRWLAPENKFKCPCHGSGFTKDGTNFEGPAPRPLEHAKIVLADDGQILVDKAFKFKRELGEWGPGGYSDKPGAFLKFSS
jgi:cytochrome b6-f complex iron-sulfur subunit